MSWTEFHLNYQHGVGMTVMSGDRGLSWLPSALEGYAAGMDTGGRYAAGGALVLRLEHGRRVVGWMRGLPVELVGRKGAWEAWGVVGGEAADPRRWPWAWDELKAKRLAKLAAYMNEERGIPHLPEPPLALAALLRAFENQAAPHVIVLHEAEDEAVLPWVWLLGPIDPLEATLGPPRPRPHAARPFSYEAVWTPDEEAYTDTVLPAVRGLGVALRSIRALQRGPAALDEVRVDRERKSHVPMVPAPPEPPKRRLLAPSGQRGSGGRAAPDEETEAAPPKARRQRRPRLRPWLLSQTALLAGVLLLQAALLLELRRPKPSAAVATATPGQITTSVAVPTPTPAPPSAACTGEFRSAQAQTELAAALAGAASPAPGGRAPVAIAPSLAEAARQAATHGWLPHERERFVLAAFQLQLREGGCGPVEVDGLRGAQTVQALDRCPQFRSQSPVEALQWLCRRLVGS